MARKKLTDKGVEKAAAPTKGRTEIWDSLLPGFGLRITDRGIKSFIVMYRVNGRQRRMTLGRYPARSLADARVKARDALDLVDHGIDPAEQPETQRDEASIGDTVGLVAADFIERYAKPKNRSWAETKRVIDRYIIPAWGDRSVTEIRRRDVIKLIDSVMDRGRPYMANRLLANVRRFFNWCIERDLIEMSPASGVKPPGREIARDRVLADPEISSTWNACKALGWPFGPMFQFMLATAQRRNEVATMKWEDVDFDRRIWNLPREMTKSDRAHSVPLSEIAVSILNSVPQTGDLVFTSNGRTPVSGFSKAKKRCDEISGVSDWRLHDLRRTATSGMARLGVALHVVERIMNHSSGIVSGVAAVYNRYGYEREMREALDLWSGHLENLNESGT